MARSTSSARTPRRTTTSRGTTASRGTSRSSTATRTTSASRRSSSSSGRSPSNSQSASRQASATRRRAKRQAASKADQAQQQAMSTLRDQLDERYGQFGEQLTGTASDVRQIAGQLRSQDNDSAARLADMAAERLDQAADYLSSHNADALLDDIEGFARSKPWLAAGAAALVGFAASRALSASRRQRSGGGYVDLDAGSDFDEADAAAAYPDEPVTTRSRS